MINGNEKVKTTHVLRSPRPGTSTVRRNCICFEVTGMSLMRTAISPSLDGHLGACTMSVPTWDCAGIKVGCVNEIFTYMRGILNTG